MTAKGKGAATTGKSNAVTLAAKPDEARDRLIAKAAASPHYGAATVVTRFAKGSWGEISLNDLARVLKEQSGKVADGDLSHAEAMLASQATALNAMFAELARRGAANMGEYIGAAETYLKLALRAQSQCRSTLETLAAIKNPPMVFAKQANIAHGPQQVNNEPAHIARAEQIENKPNELLEHDHGQRLDTGKATTAGSGHQAVEAVAAIHRPANGRRKGSGQP